MEERKLNDQQAQALAHHARVMNGIYDAMARRGQTLHAAQVRVAKDIFNEGKRVVQAQWGRKAGKTLTACFIAWVYALLNPGTQVWIICPQRKQGNDIYWVSGRIQNFGPQEYVTQHMSSQLTVMLNNGSLIRIDGCENYPALRGINPDLVIYDEFQDHSKEFDLEVMRPNLLAKNASLLVIGTPPSKDCYYTEFRAELLAEIKGGDKTRSYYEFPSSVNPSINHEELEKTRIRLCRSGNEKIWLREHMGQMIYGGEGAVFPAWNREKHMRKHGILTAALAKDQKGLKWFTMFDPGNTTCFAALFVAWNPYTAQLFLLDEIYETDPKKTDALSIWERAIKKEQELYPGAPYGTWRRMYDEAAAWFAINVRKYFPNSKLSPAKKNKSSSFYGRENDSSLFKQIMAMENVLFVSDRCEKLAWEVENYVVDENGNFPDSNDHLLDCVFYLLYNCNFKFLETVPPDVGGYITYHTEDGDKKFIPSVVKLEDWGDNVVETSLEVTVNDLFNEYLQ